jgi:hypothetical protein
LIENAGLKLVEIRPGIDAFTLMFFYILGCPSFFKQWFEQETIINFFIGCLGRLMGKKSVWINTVKLLLSGSFNFIAAKR